MCLAARHTIRIASGHVLSPTADRGMHCGVPGLILFNWKCDIRVHIDNFPGHILEISMHINTTSTCIIVENLSVSKNLSSIQLFSIITVSGWLTDILLRSSIRFHIYKYF